MRVSDEVICDVFVITLYDTRHPESVNLLLFYT